MWSQCCAAFHVQYRKITKMTPRNWRIRYDTFSGKVGTSTVHIMNPIPYFTVEQQHWRTE